MDNENITPIRMPQDMSQEELDKALSQALMEDLKKKLDEALGALPEAKRKEFEEAIELWITHGGS